MEKSERQIQAEIKKHLDLLRIPYSVNAPSNPKKSWGFQARKGWPDIVGSLPPNGRFLAIEVKALKGRLSEDQESVLESLARSGALVMVVRSTEEFRQALGGLS